MQLLDEAGYTNIVGVKGGFNKYYSTFDAKNRRRVVDIMESVYTADGDAAGARRRERKRHQRSSRSEEPIPSSSPHVLSISDMKPTRCTDDDDDAPFPIVIITRLIRRHPRLGSSVRSNGCAAPCHQSRYHQMDSVYRVSKEHCERVHARTCAYVYTHVCARQKAPPSDETRAHTRTHTHSLSACVPRHRRRCLILYHTHCLIM